MPRPPASTPISRTPASFTNGVEDAHRVAAAADARDDRIRQAAELLETLRARFAADDRLELAHHERIRMRPQHAAEQVIRVGDVGHPVTHGLVDRVLQRPRSGAHLDDFGAEQPHAEHVERLPRHVVRAHVDMALESSSAHTVAVATPCWPAPVSATMRRLPTRGEQRAAEGVVDFVRAGVREVFPFEHDARAASGRRQPCRLDTGVGLPIVAQQPLQLARGTFVLCVLEIRGREFFDRRDGRLEF
jgi:hypothetical protein